MEVGGTASTLTTSSYLPRGHPLAGQEDDHHDLDDQDDSHDDHNGYDDHDEFDDPDDHGSGCSIYR